MKSTFLGFIGILAISFLVACVADPSTPGGKLGSKSYLGSYTMGASSGGATSYLYATGDTTIELTYSFSGGANVQLTNIGFQAISGGYSLNKADVTGTLSGTTTLDFGILTWQYVTPGTTIGFTGNKVQ